MENEPLKIFVAMPGTHMGDTAGWKDPESIKTHFYNKICEQLENHLGRKVTLTIEKDRPFGGPIHPTMFGEAMNSEVYIADLTGNNANVYLELGTRWALRDAVTIVVTQNLKEILFNAAIVRAIEYGLDPGQLADAIKRAVQFISEGLLQTDYCDSPVRQNKSLITIDRKYIEQIQSENAQLRAQRGEDLFVAAKAVNSPEERLRLLRDAARINPSRTDILVEVGIELRRQSQFEESVNYLKQAIALDPKLSIAHRELGITYGRWEKSELAVESLNEAVRLAPDDAEAQSNAGGALRRWGLRNAPHNIDWDVLRSARDRYASAAKLEPYKTYGLLNLAKLDLILSKDDSARFAGAMDQFNKLKPLCEFNVNQEPEDPWRRFDLAESHLFSEDFSKVNELYKDGIKLVRQEHRKSYLSSVIGPLKEILALEVLSFDLKRRVEDICKLLEEHMQAGSVPQYP